MIARRQTLRKLHEKFVILKERDCVNRLVCELSDDRMAAFHAEQRGKG